MSSDPTQAEVSRTQKRQLRENEVVRSDRIELIQCANDFVEHMVTKQVLPIIASSVPRDVEMCEDETAAYKSALHFLKRQFDQGYSDADAIEKRVEVDESTEFKSDKPTA